MLIFEHSKKGRRGLAQAPATMETVNLPEHLVREDRAGLPEVSELQAVRHYTRLSQKNFSIDTQLSLIHI